MSRWVEEIENSRFIKDWNSINELLESIESSENAKDMQEVARLKKVVNYIKNIIESIDSELFPLGAWDSLGLSSEACLKSIDSYVADKSSEHIMAANNHADRIIEIIKPHAAVVNPNAVGFLSVAFRSYKESIFKFQAAIEGKLTESIGESQKVQSIAKESLKDVMKTKNEIEAYKRDLLDDEENKESIKTSLDRTIESVREAEENILAYSRKLLVGDDQEYSLVEKIKQGVDEVNSAEKQATEKLAKMNDVVRETKLFHSLVFGEDGPDGKAAGGLKFEAEKRIKELDDFQEEQKNRYSALLEQIENLLPGATSAGLASAYREMKESFLRPIYVNSIIFYVALIVIFMVGLPAALEGFRGEITIDKLLAGTIYRAPMYLAAIWLAAFASKRRSEAQRLQQEYAHKEALAKSYDSFKKQLENLDENDAEMLKGLILSAIEAVSYNPSQTLDGKHMDENPSNSFIRRFLNRNQ